jgi:hypothetical protein
MRYKVKKDGVSTNLKPLLWRGLERLFYLINNGKFVSQTKITVE